MKSGAKCLLMMNVVDSVITIIKQNGSTGANDKELIAPAEAYDRDKDEERQEIRNILI